MLPNLIIIGAAKAGTTSLHYYLGLHPDIAMARVKELHFFSHPDRWQKGIAWYESNFRGEAAIHGEASPSYTAHPRYPQVPERMHAVVPDARLVYIVRDPVQRAVSNYLFARADGREPRSLHDALTQAESRYVAESKYWMQLEQYLRFYEPSRVLIVAQEELSRDVRGTVQQVCRFLGIDDPPEHAGYSVRLNESMHIRQRGRIARRLAGLNNTRIVQMVPMSIRLRFGRALYLPFSTPMERQALDDRLRDYLVSQLAEDVARFRSFTGRRFEEWTI